MKKSTLEQKQRVLIFSPLRRLIGMCHSMTGAATALQTSSSNVYAACTGASISCKGVYLRAQSQDVEIEDADYGELKLEEYDELCGNKRKYYPNRHMSREGMRYNTKGHVKRKKKPKTDED